MTIGLICAPLPVPTGESAISPPVVPNRKPVIRRRHAFTRQDRLDGAACPEHQNDQRQTDQHQQRRANQLGNEYLPGYKPDRSAALSLGALLVRSMDDAFDPGSLT